MLPIDTYLYTAAASRAIDASAIEKLGVPGYTLMQRAAQAAFTLLLQSFPEVSRISVVCGKGNNAGDAYLLAGLARQMGIQVQLIAALPPAELQGDAALAHAHAMAIGVDLAAPDEALTGEVIVDGLLGSGLQGPPREAIATWIEQINASARPVLSLDLPSGVETDTGAAPGAVVQATLTLSFITRKIGLYTGAGLSLAGQRHVDDLGVPAHCYAPSDVVSVRWQAKDLPMLDLNTYKHRQGHVVIAGGDLSMPGAVSMAAQAALRVGAGMVTVLTHAQHTAALVSRTPEVMVVGFNPDDDDAGESAAQLLQKADCVVLGPGLGRSQWSEALYRKVEISQRPTVLDADGLFWLAAHTSWHGGPLTITPHVAEAARLLGVETDAVQANRLSSARQLSKQYSCHGVLKGAGSVVFADQAADLGICMHGNPGMATAGMGDVLSGILGALVGQYARSSLLEPDLALRLGVSLHSAAADSAALQMGQRSLLATDVIAALPKLLQQSTGQL